MRGCWLVFLLQPEDGEETNEIIPLANGSSAVGTREYYYQRLVAIGLKEGKEELIPLVEKFVLGPNPELHAIFFQGRDVNLTNRKTGSTLTPDRSQQDASAQAAERIHPATRNEVFFEETAATV